MNHKITANCRQALLSPVFFLSAAGTAILLFLSCSEQIVIAYRTIQGNTIIQGNLIQEGMTQTTQESQLLEYGFHGNLILTALSSDTLVMIFPIVSALPFTASYIDDIKSGFVKEYLPRMGRSNYIKGKLIGCIISGGTVFMTGVLLAYGISALIFSPMEAALGTDMENPQYLLQIIRQCGLYFCSGAFWSLVGITLSAVTGSKYMAYASPFIFYYILIILCERYFKSFYVLYPKEWLSPSQYWPLGNWSVVLWILELSALCSLYFYVIAKRKLERL